MVANQWPSGINEVIPFAMLLHANVASDVRTKHVKDCVTIILFILVVNSGKLILELVQHVRRLNATIRIVVITVIEMQCVSARCMAHKLGRSRRLFSMALRLSDYQFAGVEHRYRQ